MITRLAEENDIKTLKMLWKEGFSDSDGFIEWYFSQRFPAGGACVVDDGGRIVSMAFYQPMRIALRGKVFDAAMLNGVYTIPECRKRGLMHKCVLFLQKHARGAGIPIMIDTPAGKNHYHALGHRYITGSEEKLLQPDGNESLKLLKDDALSHISELTGIYERMCAGYSAMIVRNDAAMRGRIVDLASDGAQWLILKDAYAAVYELKEKFICPECAFADEFAKDEILCALGRLGKSCEVKLPGKRPTAVGAALDAKTLLRAYNLPYSIELKDDVLVNNNGIFSMDGEEHAPACTLNTADMLPVLAGYCELSQADGIIIHDEKNVMSINEKLHKTPCYMIEEY